jgi:hypothetical protein
MGRGRRLGPLKKDRGKVLRGDDGRSYRITQILACLRTGSRRCDGIVHRVGRISFSGRAFDVLPRAKFQHCTSKFFPGEVPWEERTVQAGMRSGMTQAAAVAAVRQVYEADKRAVEAVVEAPMEGREEDGMNATKKVVRAVRFNNEKNGPMLLDAVRVHQRDTGKKLMFDNFWPSFAQYAEQSALLKKYGGDANCWRGRYNNAAYRFSPEGEVMRQQADRVRAVAKQQGIRVQALIDIMGGNAGAADAQLTATRPWEDGMLAALAGALKVDVAYLRDGTSVAARQTTLADLRGPSEEAQRATKPVVEAVQHAQVRANADAEELRILRKIIGGMGRLADNGFDMPNLIVRAAVQQARGADPFIGMVEALVNNRPGQVLTEDGRR